MTEREQYIVRTHRKGRKAVEADLENYCICAHCITIVHTALVQRGDIPCCPICRAYRFEQDFKRMKDRLFEMRVMSSQEIIYHATCYE